MLRRLFKLCPRKLLNEHGLGDDYDIVARMNIFLAKRTICAFETYHEDVHWLIENVQDRENAIQRLPTLLPFDTLLIDSSPLFKLHVAELHAAAILQKVNSLHVEDVVKKADIVQRKLKLGYISFDWGNHPTAHLAISLFQYQNKRDFQSYVFDLGNSDGEQSFSCLKR